LLLKRFLSVVNNSRKDGLWIVYSKSQRRPITYEPFCGWVTHWRQHRVCSNGARWYYATCT